MKNHFTYSCLINMYVPAFTEDVQKKASVIVQMVAQQKDLTRLEILDTIRQTENLAPDAKITLWLALNECDVESGHLTYYLQVKFGGLFRDIENMKGFLENASFIMIDHMIWEMQSQLQTRDEIPVRKEPFGDNDGFNKYLCMAIAAQEAEVAALAPTVYAVLVEAAQAVHLESAQEVQAVQVVVPDGLDGVKTAFEATIRMILTNVVQEEVVNAVEKVFKEAIDQAVKEAIDRTVKETIDNAVKKAVEEAFKQVLEESEEA